MKETSKPVVTPGIKNDSVDADEVLEDATATAYRSMAMRAADLAEDRPDLRFGAIEAARFVQQPTTIGVEMVKRIARYLLGGPRHFQRMERQGPQGAILCYSDSDFAGCRRCRRARPSGTR